MLFTKEFNVFAHVKWALLWCLVLYKCSMIANRFIYKESFSFLYFRKKKTTRWQVQYKQQKKNLFVTFAKIIWTTRKHFMWNGHCFDVSSSLNIRSFRMFTSASFVCSSSAHSPGDFPINCGMVVCRLQVGHSKPFGSLIVFTDKLQWLRK
jgi:hypothetical protein